MVLRHVLSLATAALLGGALAAGPLAAPAGARTRPTGRIRSCSAPATAQRQLRGVWIASVTNIDWPSSPGLPIARQQAEYVRLLDNAVARHLNAVFVQVRPTADAFWPSPYEPWSQWLTGTQGKNPGYDPLAFLVREAHARGLEFHAWFNPYRVSMKADPSLLTPDHPARRHPGWVHPYGGKLYYDPGIPAVRRFVERAMLDAVRRYDIDGVHFDDYFYPYPSGGADFPDDATFARYGSGFADKASWRRHNIDLLVREMDRRIHALKPWVKFGISPFGIWRNKTSDPEGSDTNGTESYTAISADTRGWVKKRWIDYIAPQVYWYIGFAIADYAKLVPWWARQVAGTGVQLYIGQADYRQGAAGQAAPWQDPAELSRHLTFDQAYPQVAGDIHFSAKDMDADRIGAVSRMVADHYARPALVPLMPRLGGRAPHRPQPVVEGSTVTWRPVRGAARYAVYRFDGPAAGCDLDEAHRVAVTGGTSFTDGTAEPGRAYVYVVTALDRLWNESGGTPTGLQ
ncbi:family 10 glycosylhydrolase [Actinoallomurus sp. NPDC050550]|uniref:glycoside hydrolase family 10 protein n=1 Tax=Actinoallomurus sp. NPDC050550 TaxID=3154937 RepID=UPI0033F8406E